MARRILQHVFLSRGAGRDSQSSEMTTRRELTSRCDRDQQLFCGVARDCTKFHIPSPDGRSSGRAEHKTQEFAGTLIGHEQSSHSLIVIPDS